MKRAFEYLKVGLGICTVLLLLWAFVVELSQPIPDYAHVMVDDRAKIYYAPMYFYDNDVDGWQKLRLTTAGEAKNLGYEPDPKCRAGGYFIYDMGAQVWTWLDNAGIIKQKRRWNPDGSWNW